MCDCIEKIQEALAEYNTRLVIPLSFSIPARPKMAIVATEKIETKKRGKAIRLYARCCPFCGIEYEQEPDNAGD